MTGCFLFLLVIGLVLYFVLRGRSDRREQLGASARPMGSGPIAPQTFPCPHPKCPGCGAAGGTMKQQWDGFRKVSWTCSYCGWTGVQELKDEELPPSARQRLGLDGRRGYDRDDDDHRGFQGGGMGSGMGGLMTGMMLGSMLGGGHSHGHSHGDSGGWGDSGSDSGSGDDSGWGSGDSGSDWGGGSDDWGGGGGDDFDGGGGGGDDW